MIGILKWFIRFGGSERLFAFVFEFGLIGYSVEFHLLYQSRKAVGTRGREILRQSDFVDEIEVGIGYFSGRMVIEHLEQHTDYPFDNYGVAVGGEVYQSFGCYIGMQPCAALTSLDYVGGNVLPMSII